MTTKIAAAVAVATALSLAPAGADAKPSIARYAGRTAEGQRIAFTVRKGVAWDVRAKLKTICRASNQGVVTDPTPTDFEPDWGFPLGHRVTAKDKVGYPLRTYEMTTRRRGHRITGTIALRYSEIAISPATGMPRSRTCQGTTRFSAPRR